MSAELSVVDEQWTAVGVEYGAVLEVYKQYIEKLNELEKVQKNCSDAVKNHSKSLLELQKSTGKLNKDKSLSNEEKQKLDNIQTQLSQRLSRISEVQDNLPKANKGTYLDIILGPVNVSILNKTARYVYKDGYEKFKFTVTIVALVSSILALLFRYRVLDAMCNFLLVWYYCTLTIREAILRVNGSRIKGWWVFKHYVATGLCGVALTWPDGICYQQFRRQLLWHSVYLAFVQVLQTQYQRGLLYRQRALGEGHAMHITMEGFHSSMWKGLSFLLPFLIGGHIYQAYNSYVLFYLWKSQKTAEWQVLALCSLFLVLFFGNLLTTLVVVFQKPRKADKLKTRYAD